jgi:antitoxin VapB
VFVKTAKVFWSGNSQAVRIPKEFAIEADEVEIHKRGGALILRPKVRSWTPLFQSLDKFTDDFMKRRPKQLSLKKRPKAFP